MPQKLPSYPDQTLVLSPDVEVELIDHMGGDTSVVRSARVSVKGANEVEEDDGHGAGLIRYLMEKKHGTPFEHNAMTFYVKAPIFVFREFHRHRIGFSYNEMSGRYMELPAEFYVPGDDRPLINIGTSARPEMAPASEDVITHTQSILTLSYQQAWDHYQNLLRAGVAKEIARACLPVGVMSQMYVTCNARSLMAFLSLRTHEAGATHVSHPQYEIELVARKMEAIFGELFPTTAAYYNLFGRVAP